MYTFHKSVRGHLHILRELPCEDFSGSFSDEKGRYYIAAIADGHGDPACFRSNRGSRFAIEIAIDCLKTFADTVYESDGSRTRYEEILLTSPREREALVRHLTDTITAKWTDCVYSDLENDPPNADERDEKYKENERRGTLEHIYGTTLIAGIMLPSFLLLIHQGDGRCDVFYSDGHVDQPIPWDDRCVDTATTSLCDSDVMESFRHCVINLEENPVIACFMGSDGVEDAYRDSYEDMAGVHTFYKDVLVHACTMDEEQFESFLEEMLPEFSAVGRFSQSGSGDDVSVAGIVSKESAKQFLLQYQRDIRRYQLQEDLFWKKDELRGKVRKHDILNNRLKAAFDDYKKVLSENERIEQTLLTLKAKAVALVEETIKVKSEMEANAAQEEEVVRKINEDNPNDALREALLLGGKRGLKDFLNNIGRHRDEQQRRYRKLIDDRRKVEMQIEQAEKELEIIKGFLEEKHRMVQDAEEKFNDYDSKYKIIEKKIREIEHKIDSLDKNEETSANAEEPCGQNNGQEQSVDKDDEACDVPVHFIELKNEESQVAEAETTSDADMAMEHAELNTDQNAEDAPEEGWLDE